MTGAVLLALLVPGMAYGEGHGWVEVGRANEGYGVGGGINGQGGGPSAGTAGGSRAGRQGPSPADVAWVPGLADDGEGGRCITWGRQIFPGAANSRVQEQAEALLYDLLQTYDMCPGEAANPIDPAAVAEALALRFFEEAPLDRPAPRIQPGWALTGKQAFLEVGSAALSRQFSFDTVVGRINLDVTSYITVDWGDGTTTGPHYSEGGPWPDGDITHIYQRAGVYTVTVTQHWEGDWGVTGGAAGGLGGDLPPLPLTSTIDNFEARQVQAVRNR